MTLDRLCWIFGCSVGIVVGGAFCLGLMALVELARRLIYRRRYSFRSLFDRARTGLERFRSKGGFPYRSLIPLAGGVLLAAKCYKALVIAFFFLLSGAVLAWFISRGRERVHSGQVDELVEKLASIWMVEPQPFAALERAAEGMDDPLRGMLKSAVDSYRIGVPARRVWADLREQMDDPYLRQLVDILAWGQEAGMSEVEDALNGLEERLRARRDVRRRAKVSLAMISGTTKFFQAADGALLVAVPFMRYLWSFYSATTARQLLFCLVASWFLIGALYMQMELERVKEKVP